MDPKTFSTKQFHLWPFYNGFHWRGFMPTYTISVGEQEIVFSINGKSFESFSPSDVEATQISKTWFGLGSNKIGLSTRASSSMNERGDHWYLLRNEYCYFEPNTQEEIIIAFRDIKTKCFKDSSVSLKDGTLWMSSDFIIEYDGKGKDIFWALEIPSVKYYYTQRSIIPFLKPILVTGSNYALRIEKLNSTDIAQLKQHIIVNGALLGDISNVSYSSVFSIDNLWKPKLWFSSATIGLGDKGINFSQKTFKTSENIFLPYDKVFFATSASKWYRNSSQLFIFGEQNIVPLKKFRVYEAKRIIEELREKGIGKIEGPSFSESYFSSAWGVIFSILTLGLLYCFVSVFSNRKTMVIGENSFIWNGDTWLMDLESFYREKNKEKQKFFVGNISEIESVFYIKKRWYHLWGTLYIWLHPNNIRSLAYEGSQDSQDYDIEMGKIFTGTANKIIKMFEEGGYEEDSSLSKMYKNWVKHTIAQK